LLGEKGGGMKNVRWTQGVPSKKVGLGSKESMKGTRDQMGKPE